MRPKPRHRFLIAASTISASAGERGEPQYLKAWLKCLTEVRAHERLVR